MATYRKDRNFIIISLNEVAGDYRLDINTGILYGVKGNPIKTCPHKNEVRRVFSDYRAHNSNLEQVLYQMIDACTSTSQYAKYAPILLAADKIDALGAGILNLCRDHYSYVGDHIKELVTYLKDNNAPTLTSPLSSCGATSRKPKSPLVLWLTCSPQKCTLK